MEVQPESYSAKIGLAFVFFQSQRQTEATELLEQVIESHASTFVSYYLLGELRIREGLTEDALKYTKRAAALEDGFAAVHTNLGKLYIKKKEYTSAIRELQRATELDPEDTTAHYQLSIACRRAGEKEKSRQALAEVRRLNKQQRKLGTTRFLAQKLRKVRTEALQQARRTGIPLPAWRLRQKGVGLKRKGGAGAQRSRGSNSDETLPSGLSLEDSSPQVGGKVFQHLTDLSRYEVLVHRREKTG